MRKRSKKPVRQWVYVSPKPPKPQVPDDLKAEVTAQANGLLAELNPLYIKPPPPDSQWNYVVDLSVKWVRSSCYFCAKYACPGPHALSPFFETRFARMEYVGQHRFNLAFMRYTGQWIELEQGLTLNACLEAIKGGGFYQP